METALSSWGWNPLNLFYLPSCNNRLAMLKRACRHRPGTMAFVALVVSIGTRDTSGLSNGLFITTRKRPLKPGDQNRVLQRTPQ